LFTVALGVVGALAVAGIGAFFLSRKSSSGKGKGSDLKTESSRKQEGLVLYTYDHCPFCAKVKMILGIKDIPYKNEVFLNDDEKTPVSLVGKKVVPILKKLDGTYMPESMDIVKYVDAEFGKSKVLGNQAEHAAVKKWLDDTDLLVRKLVYPRYVLPEVNFAEFATKSAIEYFVGKREGTLEVDATFSDFLQRTPELRAELEGKVAELDAIIPGDGKTFLYGEQFNECDIHLYSRLRSISIVKGFKWTAKTRRYIDFLAKNTKVPLFESRAV
jgi:glutaredoxin 2